MTTRDELHKLVDSLSEGAMEAAHRMLSNLQVWPPPPSPNLQEMRKRMDERRLEMMQGRKPGTILGFGGLVAMIRRKGHELTIVEHIRPEGDRLIYKHAGRDRVFPY